MSRLTATVAVAAALATAVVSQGFDVNSVPGERECTKKGNRCAGETGFPNVPYEDCCEDTQVCAKPKGEPKAAWGFFCLNTRDAEPGTTLQGGGSTGPGSDGGKTTGGGAATTGGSKTTTKKDDDDKAKASDDEDEKTAKETEEDDDGSVCFPADATVELQDGSVARMEDVSVGDMVKVAPGAYSRVFLFTHKTADVESRFVTIETAAGQALSLTPGHYIYANDALVSAGEVRVGDVLRLGDGSTSAVNQVGRETGRGLYNPQTVNGNVVVNGIQASTYTTAVEPSFAHAILAPLRSAFEVFGFATGSLENGSPMAEMMPNGAAVVA